MKETLEQIGCPAEKVTIHPLGIDVENLPSRPRTLEQGEPLRVLFAGTFREKKGIQYLIEAAAHRDQAHHVVDRYASSDGSQDLRP